MTRDGYSTDDGKIKRNLEDEQAGYNEKIPRTHHKPNRKNEKNLGTLIEMMKDLKTEVYRIKEEQNENSAFIMKIILGIGILKKETEKVRRENSFFNEDLSKLNRQIE
ncbi:hypothetical protein HHI36_017231 [Cryptolaemus montrouzieri]|uniref:Uncharacterized protein n=1 Tax=Cryptolaemus montrouzieri TaxID=559131 RepID=A0ABD2NMQ9_9CUCU